MNFAATNGGTTAYPWGNDRSKARSLDLWPRGHAGPRSHVDQSAGDRALLERCGMDHFALCFLSGSSANDARAASGARTVRGGTKSVVDGEPDFGEAPDQWVPVYRMGYPRERFSPRARFPLRAQRKPRFLNRETGLASPLTSFHRNDVEPLPVTGAARGGSSRARSRIMLAFVSRRRLGRSGLLLEACEKRASIAEAPPLEDPGTIGVPLAVYPIVL